MVAYNFAAMFEGQVRAKLKLQTVRAKRKRQARVGEDLQLFCGMRTRNCRRLLDPDPVCTAVVPITIITTATPYYLDYIGAIVLDGRRLSDDEIESFAVADGFGGDHVGDLKLRLHGVPGSARFNMGHFWAERHGLRVREVFEGDLIRWRAR